MNDQLATFLASRPVDALFLPIGILVLPILLTLSFRQIALNQQTEPERNRIWASYREFTHFILVLTVAAWWVIWDLRGRDDLVSVIGSHWLQTVETSSLEAILFWIPPTVSLGIFLSLCRAVDKIVLRLKWTAHQILVQVCWILVSLVIPLLMVAAGFSNILDRKLGGIAWLISAGVISRVGTAFLRLAQGMKFNRLKSGELRNQALSIASGMGVPIGKVFVVPAGKGHLINGFGMRDAIGLTDNLGKYLTKAQKGYVIAHELAHVRLKHSRKHLLLVMAIFSITTLLLFSLPKQASPVRPVIQVLAIFGPLVTLYYGSRHFEYCADRQAVDFTGDAEIAIQALANLERSRELPVTHTRLMEWFMTHPTFEHRVDAIAKLGCVPADRLTVILEQAGIPASAA